MEKQRQPIKFTWEGVDIFLPTVVISSDLRRIADDHALYRTRKKTGVCASSSKSQSSIWNSWSDEEEDGGEMEVNSISNKRLENSNEITSDGQIGKGSNWNNLIETLNSKPFVIESEHNTKNMPKAFKSGKERAKDDIADNGLFRRKFQSKEELLRNWKGAKVQSATESLLQKCEKCGLEIGGNSNHQCICSKETIDRVGNKQTEIGEDDNCSARVPIIPDELNCTECGKTFSKKIHLILHKKIHARMTKFTSLKYVPKKFACNFCELQFDSNNELVSHFQANHYKNLNGRSPETKTVEQNTWNHNVSGVLMRKSGESDPITCTECNEIFQNIIKLNEHSRTHQGLPLTDKKEFRLEEFSCSKCGRTFERQNQLKFHSTLCRSQIDNKNSLNEMVQKEPTSSDEPLLPIAYEDLKFHCKLCNHRFYKQWGLNQHMAKAHRISSQMTLKKFRCSECGRKFRHRHHLMFHMKSHVKLCKTCGVQFDEITFLEHLKSCSDMKSKNAKSAIKKEPVPCDICGKICNGEEELSEHCLIHAFGMDEYINEESLDFLTKLQYVCQNFACQRRFSHEADLIYHVERNHLIKDPICCEICGKIYSDETALMDHRSSDHCLNTPRNKQQIPSVLETPGSEADTQEGSAPTYYYIQDGYPQPPDPYVLLLRDFNGPVDRLLEKLSREEKLLPEAEVKPRSKSFHTATPVVLKRRRKHRGIKPREDIPFQNFYICEICNRRFQKRNLFIIHLTYHKNKNKFECHLCDKKFHARVVLEHHIERHNDPGFTNRPGRAGRTDIPFQDVYTCEMCNKKFQNRRLYFVHLFYHKNRNKYECHLCDRKFHVPFLLQQHIKRHNDPGFTDRTNYPGRAGRTDVPHQDVYTCEICNRKFQKRHLYFIHLSYHKNRNKYECHLCDRKFHAPFLLQQHLNRHNDPGFTTNTKYRGRAGRPDVPHQDVYTCEVCNRKFQKRHDYFIHMNYHNKKRIPCKLCDRTFTDSQSLTEHIQKHSDPNFVSVSRPGRGGRPDVPKQDVYYCEHCGDRKPFTDRSKYILHIRYHNLEEKFECPHCPRRFKVEASLKLHMKIHSDVKRFKCEGCLKKFKLKQTLQSHEKFCKNIPCKYKCKSCGDMFHNKITLERHVGTYHSKSRPVDPDFETPMIEHPCPHCSQSFTTTFGLTKHIAIYHPELDTAPTIKSEPEYIAHGGDNHGYPIKDNTVHSVSAAGGEDEDDTSAGDPEWVPSPDDGADEHDVSDMYLSNFCEAQLIEEQEPSPIPQPTKERDWKPRVTCNCGKHKKYETQKFCHATRCPCVHAGKACHLKCRCKDGCVNNRDSELEQQKKFREGRETMLVEAQKELEATTSSNYTVMDDVRIYPTQINPTPALSVGHSISSFGHKPVIQSEFISIDHETQDETMRELTLSGYVEGAEDDPLAEADNSPNSPDVEFSSPELLNDPFEPTSNATMPLTTTISKSLNITTSDGSSSVSMQASSNSQGQSFLLQCHVCGMRSIRLMTAYISHMLLHNNETSGFKCPLCEITFDSVLTLVKHLDGHNQGINLQCTKCSSKFKTYTDMERHLKVHHFKPMECGLCSVKFTDTQVMMRHWSQQHPTCQCGVCLIKFFSHEDLTYHMKTLHSPYDCLSCNTRFEKLDELLEHFKRMHMRAPTFAPSYTAAMPETLLSCNYCGAKFSTGEKLNSHLADHLTGHSTRSDSDLRCNTCGQVLRSMEELTDHLSNHIQALHNKTVTVTALSNAGTSYQTLGQGSYSTFEQEDESIMQASESLVCPQCNSSYTKRSAWVTHVKSHKISMCSSCYQTFSSENTLEQHLQTSSCKIYKCDKCPRNFKDSKYLSQHRRVHAKEALAATNLITSKHHSRSEKESGHGDDGGFSTAPVIVASHSLAAQNAPRNEYPASSNHGRSASIEEITLD